MEFDCDLTPDQWETLKALRVPASKFAVFSRLVIDDLVALRLVTTSEGCPAITSKGRKVLIRGSSRLWDVAA
jgi:hypothetical protein